MASLNNEQLTEVISIIKEEIQKNESCDIKIFVATKRLNNTIPFTDMEDMHIIIGKLILSDDYKLVVDSNPYLLAKKKFYERKYFNDIRAIIVSAITALLVSLIQSKL